MSGDGRLLLVSNRLPVGVRRSGATSTLTPSTGGLVAGLGPAHAAGDGLWIGTFDAAAAGAHAAELAARRLVPVTLDEADAAAHYQGYSNRVLWPLCHYLLEHVEFDGPDYDAYARVNARFADAVVAHARPNDAIWVHDYHLMLLPQLLRARLPRARIGFFFHIPFPSSEVFRILPRKEEILRGLLGANLIGVHTYDYARHLVSTLRRVLAVEFDEDWVSVEDGSCRIGAFPLGIDTAAHAARAGGAAVQRRVTRLRRQVQGRKVILGVDRMDYTKGLLQRLGGFAQLLARCPQWRERCVLFQLAVPSRASLASYRHLKEAVDRRVGEINGAYQSGGLTPIVYMYRAVPADELAALYALADVALVTPTRDGMNLVAKEYVACRRQDSGVLVLSEFAGAAAEMGEALQINPHDAGAICRALQAALEMGEAEEARRMAALRARVAANTVHDWVERFLRALRTFAPVPEAEVGGERRAWRDALAADFVAAPRALLALDYDGTLQELVPTPAAAAPGAELLALLRALAALPGVEVALVSGRDPQTMLQWFGALPVHLLAEHGFHSRLAGAGAFAPFAPAHDLTWMPTVREILAAYARRAPGAHVEEKPLSLVWHYRQAEPGFGTWMARELAAHLGEVLANSPVTVQHGHKVVEVRPQGCDKGRALLRLVTARGPFGCLLAAGDDRTDEDMFVALPPRAWSIRIGAAQPRSHARFLLPHPAALRQLLAGLAGARRDAVGG